MIKVHPMALVRFDEIEDRNVRARIEALTAGFDDKSEFFVATLARGIARIAAAHYPNPVIVRMSDFKTNEYARLIGGAQFEPEEENPMLGWARCQSLLQRRLSRGIRAGVSSDQARARGNRSFQCRCHDSVLPHA